MNDRNRLAVETRRHPGRIDLIFGILFALAGIAIYFVQVSYAKMLTAPWYVPMMATGGAVLIVWSLVRSRSLIRWACLVVITLLAAGEWFMMLVALSAPEYKGPVKAEQPFPSFMTTLADGSPFTQDHLKGSQNTVMVFYRGWW